MKKLIEQLEEIRMIRHGKEACEQLKKARVGIAGLGGLGSHIGFSLARLGVGQLVLADFDTVDVNNIHRQCYLPKHINAPKTKALSEQLLEIHPTLELKIHNQFIDASNAMQVFGDCHIVCEAFDTPSSKEILVETLLTQSSQIEIIAASGMAGLLPANLIVTKKRIDRLIICGDGVSDVAKDGHLYAPRVAICANHQAMAVLNLLLNKPVC